MKIEGEAEQPTERTFAEAARAYRVHVAHDFNDLADYWAAIVERVESWPWHGDWLAGILAGAEHLTIRGDDIVVTYRARSIRGALMSEEVRGQLRSALDAQGYSLSISRLPDEAWRTR